MMSIIFITGLSGCGKSTTIAHLKAKGYVAFDLDEGYTITNEHQETLIDAAKVEALLVKHQNKDLFLSACYANQGEFYKYFDHVVLLEAPLELMKDRITHRTSNPYGKSDTEWLEIEQSYVDILPLLQQGADNILNTKELGVDEIITYFEGLL